MRLKAMRYLNHPQRGPKPGIKYRRLAKGPRPCCCPFFPSWPNFQMMGAGYDRPYGDPKLSRSVVMAPSGMVATSHTLAAQAGVEVSRGGGNAIDAAIAANAKPSAWWSR
ncbi:MAG: hypothetical protein CM1200mP29_03040 [Verrucomicrobiota bacterium]|nr:MAG: hypothetical protein CM1200mP29_03040 [Verrucomicrobiota bacterium]